MSFKIRESHWEIMLEYMEEHKDFANGRFIGAQGREIQKKMWIELSNKLNSLGFGNKTADKWQKVSQRTKPVIISLIAYYYCLRSFYIMIYEYT